MTEHSDWLEWRGIRILNYHRPMESTLSAFLDAGLRLEGYWQPRPRGASPEAERDYLRAPYFNVMRWAKR